MPQDSKNTSSFLKYSGMALQMGGIIGVFTYLGHVLDAYWHLENPYLTLGGMLMGTSMAIYTMIQQLKQGEE